MTHFYSLILAMTLSLGACYGQTSRYWALNFASEPSILGGAVVGGFADNQAIYYNPATISENKLDNIGLSGEIIEFNKYDVTNAFGKGFDLSSSQAKVAPSYVSIFLKSRKHKDLSMQIAVLTRDKIDFNLIKSINSSADIYPDFAGNENYSVLYETSVRYLDVWAGVGAAYKLNEGLSIGASIFFSYKHLSDKLTKSFNIETFDNQSNILFISHAREISRTSLQNYKLQSKIGLQYKLAKWRFGLNVTLPSALIYGWGDRYREVGYHNVYTPATATFLPDSIKSAGGQNLRAIYKDPLSVSLGVNYCPNTDKDMIGLSIEYFNPTLVYKMIDATGVEGNEINNGVQAPRNVDFLSVWNGADQVVNIALGYRKYINDNLSLLGGIRTDFDYLKNVDFTGTSNEYNNYIKFYWDAMHFTGGARLKILQHQFVVGAEYSYGNQSNIKKLTDFIPVINPESQNLPLENLNDRSVKLKYTGVSVFFGFIFNFKDKPVNYIELK